MKLSKEDKALAKLWKRNVELVFKAEIKGSRWRKSRETLFFVESEYFFYCQCFPWQNSKKIEIRLWCKPLGLDPIFWEIFGIPENLKKPLSHRSHAAFKCFGIQLYQGVLEFTSEQTHEAITRSVLDYIDELTNSYIAEKASIPFDQQLIETGTKCSIDLVCAKILGGNLTSAKEIVNHAIQSKIRGQYGVVGSDKSFYDYAYDWLKTM